MRARHLVLGFALTAVSMAASAATGVDTRDMASAPRGGLESAGHDTVGTNSDVGASNRDCPATTSAETSKGGSGGDVSTHAGSGGISSGFVGRHNLSWQSLLPGSIQ